MLLAAVLFYVFYWDYIAFAALVLTLALPAVLFLLTLPAAFLLRIRLEGSGGTGMRNTEIPVRVTVENRSFFPVSSAKLPLCFHNRFSGESRREILLFPIGGSNRTTLELPLYSRHCGCTEIRMKGIWLYDPLGITAVWRPFSLREEAAFFPEITELGGNAVISAASGMDSDVYSPYQRGDDPSQVFDYHEYRDGDKRKDIHWKLSQKLSRMMVKEYSLPMESRCRIAMELPAAEADSRDKRDFLLSAGASFSEWYQRQGIHHEFCWYSPEIKSTECQTITCKEEYFTALGKVLRLDGTIPSDEESPLLDSLLGSGLSGCSVLLYLTDELSAGQAAKLLTIREMMPVTVVCACASEAADSLGDGGVEVILPEESGEQESRVSRKSKD